MSDTRTVFCQKLGKDLPALDAPPIPGDLGKRIQENISAEAWQMFERHFIMVCNELRLNLMDDATTPIFLDEIERFLFQDIAKPPEGYVPPAEG